ncbi:hypothetical protein G6F57_022332 [Rhizopus arrhizus]|nr:hypothetical protein G6F57_022332 [Rhizopus arrhizus]
MIASAMLLRPALLIADEPTTALDAVIQREVMEMLPRPAHGGALCAAHGGNAAWRDRRNRPHLAGAGGAGA